MRRDIKYCGAGLCEMSCVDGDERGNVVRGENRER